MAHEAERMTQSHDATSGSDDIRTIKRYANRKLYDMKESSYVTLEEIAEFIRNGEDVRVIDNKSKEDLTAVTLTQIIFVAEKRKKRVLPLSTLRGVIQSGGEFIQKRIADPVTTFRDEAERTVTSLSREAEKKVGRLVRVEGIDELRTLLAEFAENTGRFYDDMQKAVDDRVRDVMSSLPQFLTLKKDLEALEEKVKNLEKKSGK